MATMALRQLHITPQPLESSSRISAAEALPEWLEKGGPAPVKQPRAPDAPPLVHLSSAFAIGGSESNITLVAKRTVEAGHFIMGIALSSVLHPRSEAVAPARRAKCEELAHRVRAWRTGSEGLLGDADDAYRIDLILLLALELLDGPKSVFAPYLASLPSAEDAAPPSLWPYMQSLGAGGAAATTALRDTSIGALLAVDAIELAPLFGPLAAADAATRPPLTTAFQVYVLQRTKLRDVVGTCPGFVRPNAP